MAQPQLEPEVGRSHLVGGGEPGRGGRSGDLDVDPDVVVERALVAGVVERGHHAAYVAGEVVGVAQRDLERSHLEAQPGGGSERSGDLPGAAGHHDRQGGVEAAHQRQVGVLEHEGPDEVGVPLLAAGAPRRRRVVEGDVPGREDRGVVDEAAPLGGFGRCGEGATGLL